MNLTFNKKKKLMLSELVEGDIFIFEHALDEEEPDVWMVTNHHDNKYCLLKGRKVGHLYNLIGCQSYGVLRCTINGEVNFL